MSEQRVQELADQVRQLQQLVQQQSQQILNMQASSSTQSPAGWQALIDQQNVMIGVVQRQHQDSMDRLTRAIEASRHKQSLVDPKGLGKPYVYDSDQKKWPTWSFKTANYFTAVFPDARRMLEVAEDSGDQEITADILEDHFGDGADVLDQIGNYREIDDQIYTALTQLCEGESLDIVKNVGSKSGLEAWRKLTRRYDPTTVNRRRNLMSSILSPGSFKVNELLAAIERWEEQVRQFERRRNAYGERKPIDDEIKAGILQQMCPENLRNHLYMNASRFRNYLEIRTEIISYLEARNQNDVASPMDVGSMWKGGKGDKGKWQGKDVKGKGKGKDFKGKGKGKDSKGKGKGKGHRQTEHK